MAAEAAIHAGYQHESRQVRINSTVVTPTLGSMSSRHVLPESTAKRAPEQAHSLMPGTSPGMAAVFVLSEPQHYALKLT